MPVIETVVTEEDIEKMGDHEVSQKKPVQAKPEVSAESEPEEDEDDGAPSVDYKAEAEKYKAKLKKAEFALYKKNKEDKRKPEVDDSEEEPTPVKSEVAQILEEQRKRDAEDIVEEELLNIEDEDERELTRLHLESSIVRTGYSRAAIKNDVETANFLANKPRFQRERKEMKSAAISKRTMSNATVSPNQDRPKSSEDPSKYFSKYEWDYMQKQKFTKEQIKKLIANRK